MISFDNVPKKYFPNDFPLTFTSCFIYFHFPHRVWTDSGRSLSFFSSSANVESETSKFAISHCTKLKVCCDVLCVERRWLWEGLCRVDRKCYYWPIFSFEHYVLAPPTTSSNIQNVFSQKTQAQKIIFIEKQKKCSVKLFSRKVRNNQKVIKLTNESRSLFGHACAWNSVTLNFRRWCCFWNCRFTQLIEVS